MNAQQAVHQPPPQAPAAAGQAPAPAASAAQAAAAPAASQQLYEVQTPDGIRQEPLEVLKQRYVQHSDAERRLMESNARIAQLTQENQNLAQRARMSDDLQRQLVQDPREFVAHAERLARIAEGQATPEDQAAIAKGHAPQNMQVLDQMRRELEQVKGQLAGDSAVKEVRQALQTYDLFKNNEGARQIAETTLAAMRLTQPGVSINDLASKLHTQMSDLVNKQTQQSFQARVERQATMPAGPSGHTPGMTAPEPPPTVKDLGNGNLKRRLTAFLNSPHGIQQ